MVLSKDESGLGEIKWFEVCLQVSKSQVEVIEPVLQKVGALAITYSDSGDDPILEPALNSVELWQTSNINALFSINEDKNHIIDRCRSLLHPYELPQFSIKLIADKRWERECLKDYKVIKISERLFVCPFSRQAPKNAEIVLSLDPGLAFGTGTHATTSLCLKWLDANNEIYRGKEIIDFGCGSGILAIAALLLGAKHADACDIDPQALQASGDNARINGVEHSLSLYPANDLEKKQYTLLIANILAEPLLDLFYKLSSKVKPGGYVVLSGVLQHQCDQIIEVYGQSFVDFEVIVEDDWSLIVAKKPNSIIR